MIPTYVLLLHLSHNHRNLYYFPLLFAFLYNCWLLSSYRALLSALLLYLLVILVTVPGISR